MTSRPSDHLKAIELKSQAKLWRQWVPPSARLMLCVLGFDGKVVDYTHNLGRLLGYDTGMDYAQYSQQIFEQGNIGSGSSSGIDGNENDDQNEQPHHQSSATTTSQRMYDAMVPDSLRDSVVNHTLPESIPFMTRVQRLWNKFYHGKSLAGQYFVKFLHPDDVPTTVLALSTIIDRQVNESHFEVRLMSRSGQEHYVYAQVTVKHSDKLIFLCFYDATSVRMKQRHVFDLATNPIHDHQTLFCRFLEAARNATGCTVGLLAQFLPSDPHAQAQKTFDHNSHSKFQFQMYSHPFRPEKPSAWISPSDKMRIIYSVFGPPRQNQTQDPSMPNYNMVTDSHNGREGLAFATDNCDQRQIKAKDSRDHSVLGQLPQGKRIGPEGEYEKNVTEDELGGRVSEKEDKKEHVKKLLLQERVRPGIEYTVRDTHCGMLVGAVCSRQKDPTEPYLFTDFLAANGSRFGADMSKYEDKVLKSKTECAIFGDVTVLAQLTVPVFVNDRLWGVLSLVSVGDGEDVRSAGPEEVDPRVSRFCDLATREIVRFIAKSLGQHMHSMAQEEQRKRAEDHNEKAWRLSRDLMVTGDFSGYFQKVNPAFCEVLGFTEHELVSIPYSHFIHPDDVELVQKAYDRLWSGQEVVSYRARFRCRSGGYRTVDMHASGQVQDRFTIGCGRDVTEEVQRQKQLEHAKFLAEEAAKTKSEFLANMSHEIRTPLNGITGMASLLKQTPLSDEQREYLSAILVSGEHLVTVINDILDLSKIESGRGMELEKQPINLHKCIEQALALAFRLDYHRLRILYYIHPLVPRVILGDVTRLRQIMTNLLANAFKFTPFPGEVLMTVFVERTKTRNYRQSTSPSNRVCDPLWSSLPNSNRPNPHAGQENGRHASQMLPPTSGEPSPANPHTNFYSRADEVVPSPNLYSATYPSPVALIPRTHTLVDALPNGDVRVEILVGVGTGPILGVHDKFRGKMMRAVHLDLLVLPSGSIHIRAVVSSSQEIREFFLQSSLKDAVAFTRDMVRSTMTERGRDLTDPFSVIRESSSFGSAGFNQVEPTCETTCKNLDGNQHNTNHTASGYSFAANQHPQPVEKLTVNAPHAVSQERVLAHTRGRTQSDQSGAHHLPASSNGQFSGFRSVSDVSGTLLRENGESSSPSTNPLVSAIGRENTASEGQQEEDWDVELHFVCEDTGKGIEQKSQRKLFKPFSQADNSVSRLYGGTGLGLAISSKLCRLFGGVMWAESEGIPGKGSRFHFTVKCKRGGHPNDWEFETAPVHSVNQPRCLLITHYPHTDRIFSQTFSDWGVAIHRVASLEEGLQALETFATATSQQQRNSAETPGRRSRSSLASKRQNHKYDFVVLDGDIPSPDASPQSAASLSSLGKWSVSTSSSNPDVSAPQPVLAGTSEASSLATSSHSESLGNTLVYGFELRFGALPESNSSGSSPDDPNHSPMPLQTETLSNHSSADSFEPLSARASTGSRLLRLIDELNLPLIFVPPCSVPSVPRKPPWTIRANTAAHYCPTTAGSDQGNLPERPRQSSDAQEFSYVIDDSVHPQSLVLKKPLRWPDLARHLQTLGFFPETATSVMAASSPPEALRSLNSGGSDGSRRSTDSPISTVSTESLTPPELPSQDLNPVRNSIWRYLLSPVANANFTSGSIASRLARSISAESLETSKSDRSESVPVRSPPSSDSSDSDRKQSNLTPGPATQQPNGLPRQTGQFPSETLENIIQNNQNLSERLPVTMMVVEDNAINQKLILRVLGKLGYKNLTTAANGLLAVEEVKKRHFDMIFMDIQMPVCDGFRASSLIRRLYQQNEFNRPHQPVIIAMTAHAMRGDREQCLASGMDDYLSKPIEFSALTEKIVHWSQRILKQSPPEDGVGPS